MRSSGSWLLRLTVSAAVATAFAVAVTVSSATPAVATEEEVNFVADTSSTLEGVVPTIGLQLTYDGTLTGPVVVTVAASPSGADPAETSDYALDSTVIFPGTSTSGDTLPVTITFDPDDIYENSETLTLTITVDGGDAGTRTTHIATILNDDEAPTLRIFDSSTNEASGPMIFTVTRTGETELTATAVATPTSGTATVGDDFAAAAHGVSIAPGGPNASDTITVTIENDEIYESTETFAVALSALGSATTVGSDLVAAGSISDNDSPPTLSINNVTLSESNNTATFTVVRTGQTALDSVVDIATADIDATAGNDYTGESDTITILPGGTTANASFTVSIVDDDIDEDDETFSVTLANPIQATLLDSVGIGTIIDNDSAGLSIDVGDGLLALEGAAPDTFSVALTSEPTAAVTINLNSVQDQVATTPSTLTFNSANWNSAQSVSVTALEDGMDEDDPHSDAIQLSVDSADPRYNALSPATVNATIADADALLVTIDGPSVGAPGDPVTFTAAVNAGATGDITYSWTAFYLGNDIASGDQADFQFTPNDGGPYVIQVIVGDAEGQNPAEFIPFRALADLGGSIFTDDIVWLAENEITKGCNPPVNDMFCPEDAVTRGQMAAFLVRFLGLTDDGGGNDFTDDNNSIFEADIAKLATADITKGCNPPDNTEFCPDAPVTREQMAAFMVRALGLTDDGGGNTFTDDNNSIFEADIAKLAAAGVTKGCNPPANTEFCPNAPVTREQMAAFIRRANAISQ